MIDGDDLDPEDYEAAFLFKYFINNCRKVKKRMAIDYNSSKANEREGTSDYTNYRDINPDYTNYRDINPDYTNYKDKYINLNNKDNQFYKTDLNCGFDSNSKKIDFNSKICQNKTNSFDSKTGQNNIDFFNSKTNCLDSKTGQNNIDFFNSKTNCLDSKIGQSRDSLDSNFFNKKDYRKKRNLNNINLNNINFYESNENALENKKKLDFYNKSRVVAIKKMDPRMEEEISDLNKKKERNNEVKGIKDESIKNESFNTKAIKKDSIVKDSILKDSVVKDSILKDSILKDSILKDSVVKDSVKNEFGKKVDEKDSVKKGFGKNDEINWGKGKKICFETRLISNISENDQNYSNGNKLNNMEYKDNDRYSNTSTPYKGKARKYFANPFSVLSASGDFIRESDRKKYTEGTAEYNEYFKINSHSNRNGFGNNSIDLGIKSKYFSDYTNWYNRSISYVNTRYDGNKSHKPKSYLYNSLSNIAFNAVKEWNLLYENDEMPFKVFKRPGFICEYCKNRIESREDLIRHMHQYHESK